MTFKPFRVLGRGSSFNQAAAQPPALLGGRVAGPSLGQSLSPLREFSPPFLEHQPHVTGYLLHFAFRKG